MSPNSNYIFTAEVKDGGGALVNSSAPVSVNVYLNSVVTSVASTVSNLSTGIYSISFNVPDWNHGDIVDIHVSATASNIVVRSKKSVEINSKPSLQIINEGIKKSSLLIPHNDDL